MMISDYEPCCALWRDTPGIRLTEADSREAIASFLLRNPGMSLVKGCLERLGREGIGKCHVFVLAGNILGNAF
jgi:hypothetical protein